MTPKEKAKQLVENYLKKIIELAYAETKSKELAKESALLCVDEIINDNPNIYDSDRLNYMYWNEVKYQVSLLQITFG